MFLLIIACAPTNITTVPNQVEVDFRTPLDALAFQEVESLDSTDAQLWGAADLDGDGDEDLFGFDGEYSVVMWEAIDGQLSEAVALTEPLSSTMGSGAWARQLEAADLDGDGDLELLLSAGVSSEGGWSEQVLLLDLDGGYEVLAEGSTASANAVADVDGDGASELILYTDEGARLQLSAGGSHALPEELTWAWVPHAFTVPEGILVLNDGGYGIYQGWLISVDGEMLVERHDVYGSEVMTDGNPSRVASELVLNNWGMAWRWLDGDFAELPVEEGAWLAASGNFDGLAGADLLSWDEEGATARVNRELTELPVSGLPESLWSMMAADIDGDGHDDLVRTDWTEEAQVLRVWMNISRD